MIRAYDHATERLQLLVQQRERFRRRFDARAEAFLDCLPPLFRLFHRLSFDLGVPPDARRKAACVAVYIAEAHDFRGESNRDVEGLIDDLWLAYAALNQLVRELPAEALHRHWRSEIPLARALILGRDLPCLESHVPPRVLSQLQAFIA